LRGQVARHDFPIEEGPSGSPYSTGTSSSKRATRAGSASTSITSISNRRPGGSSARSAVNISSHKWHQLREYRVNPIAAGAAPSGITDAA